LLPVQHGDETRGPDAATTGNSSSHDPNPARAIFGLTGALKYIDGDKAGDETNYARQRHQTQVVLSIPATIMLANSR
jgi:hypothetical protein